MIGRHPMTIDTLRDLAEQDLEQAVIHLGDMRRGQQQADQQLSMLLDYQNEYQQSLRQGMMGGGIVSWRIWSNYHQFIQTLEKAIEQHRQQLNQWNQRLEQALSNWREKHKQRLNAFETLIERRATAQALVQSRHEQKLMDEFAQRAALRKGE